MVRRYLARLARRYAPMAVALAALVLVFRITDWRRLIHEGQAARAEARAGGG